jgi:hypothetical protein
MGARSTTTRTRHMSPWAPLPVLLVLLMAVGSALMWVGLPLGLIWVASLLADSSQPSLGPYLLVIVGLPVGMVLVGKALSELDHAHGKLTGTLEQGQFRAPWLKSMRDDRARKRRRSVLDVVMLGSVLLCVAVLAVWFAFFAGSPLPK